MTSTCGHYMRIHCSACCNIFSNQSRSNVAVRCPACTEPLRSVNKSVMCYFGQKSFKLTRYCPGCKASHILRRGFGWSLCASNSCEYDDLQCDSCMTSVNVKQGSADMTTARICKTCIHGTTAYGTETDAQASWHDGATQFVENSALEVKESRMRQWMSPLRIVRNCSISRPTPSGRYNQECTVTRSYVPSGNLCTFRKGV